MRARAQIEYSDSVTDAVALFKKAVRDDPESVAARYGLALAHSRAGKHTSAIVAGDALFSSDPQKILYIAAYAELLIAGKRLDQAIRLLSHQLAINPDNALLAALYSDALSKNQQYAEAAAVLERQSLVNSNDVDVWYNLAEVSGKAGNIVGVHRARAEYFALNGAYHRAIQHLEYAQRLVSLQDTQLHARLDQRITDLRTALRGPRS
ncbi:MAG: tetratricopeptide repeat protein, partial [Pseudomonadales bacterium]